MNNVQKSFFLLSIGLLTLSGCGGGGGGVSEDQLTPVNTGILVDSVVEGVQYHTATQAGTTNSLGEFTYKDGELITFSIGALVFPPVVSTEVITPLTLAGASSITDQQATNIARLLQSLDEDGDPLNGIKISSIAALSATEIDFNVGSTTFETNQNVINLVANSGSVNTTLVSVANAQAHVTDTLFNLAQNDYGDEGTLEPYDPIVISSGVPHSGTISGFGVQPVTGQSIYTFTASQDGLHTISLKDVSPNGVNLGWNLYHLGTEAEGTVTECNNDNPNFEEICETPQLVNGESYMIQVWNLSSIGASYNLIVSSGDAPIPTVENEGSTGFPVTLTIQLKHEGMISANGVSVYSFTTIASIPYTVSLLNVSPLGVDLDWSLFNSNNELVHECRNDLVNGNELCTTDVYLANESSYLVYVRNWSDTAATFDLKVY